jgi:glutamate-1-semialdehyde 2,1-aminomutase
VPVQVNRVGSMLTVFFAEAPVVDAATARKASAKRFGAFFHTLLEGGVYFPPSQFEAAFLSTAHTEADLERTLEAARAAFAVAANTPA